MQVGFIGLGNMGQPIARNILKAGHSLVAYNRTRSRAEALLSHGARVANTPAEACQAELVITMLADDHAVEDVAFGEQGILASLPAGAVHVSMSTISVALSKHLAKEHAARSQGYVAAPVFGRPEAAEAAKLLVVAAGHARAVEHAKPILEAISRKLVVLATEPACANLVKLAGNFALASMLETLGEAFTLIRKAGVEPQQFHEIVNSSLFQSPVYENYGKTIVNERYEPAGFKLRLGLKDVRLVLAAADELAVPLPAASMIHDHLLEGIARGYGDNDWSVIAKILAEDAGLKARSTSSVS
jgi:3-hydroxyisobutyrate dehydrogenase-like beta-hydroxyacid dehydrogenase